MQFSPSAPLPRFIQVRPYVEFLYQYHNSSNYGYTAHNQGSFGILVNSFDLQGNDRRTEQDYRYGEPVWSDGTTWWEEHSNTSWDDSDFGFAYIHGKEAPYFLAQAGRIYLACIWCFGSLDAGAGFFGSASAVGNIRARVGFVVIGQQ